MYYCPKSTTMPLTNPVGGLAVAAYFITPAVSISQQYNPSAVLDAYMTHLNLRFMTNLSPHIFANLFDQWHYSKLVCVSFFGRGDNPSAVLDAYAEIIINPLPYIRQLIDHWQYWDSLCVY